MSTIKTYQNRIETEIEKLFSTSGNPQGLYDPINYVMNRGGKRIRPMLCLAGCGLFNADAVENAVLPAVGLEVFHNFTLLHDDLMDNADMRRNNMTVHKKWNNNTAILSGDAMFAMAYRFIAKAPEKVLLPVLDIFTQTALEVCEGQQYDMEFETRNDVTTEQYLEMIRLKTAVFLGGSPKIGAIIGEAKAKDVTALYDFGCNIGLAFQLQDDWLDVYGNSEEFGKSIGGDIVCNKKTFLLISALNNLNGKEKKELLLWLENKEFNREEKIAAVKNLYEKVKISKKTREKINFFYENSLKEISKVCGSKEILNEIVEFAHNLMERAR